LIDDMAEWWNKGPPPEEKLEYGIMATILIPCWLFLIGIIVFFVVASHS